MSAAPAPFPWDAALGYCLTRLRWPPESFWRATPRELAAALGDVAASAPPTRTELAMLMRAHPDAPA